jgi:uncharacterized membrane protein YfcA
VYEILLFVVSILAGFVGSILGIGGGMIVVPFLTLALGVDIRYAVAASLISIVATSSGAAASFLRDRLTNVRVAIFLSVGTVFGAITGFLISSWINSSVLYLVFGGFLVFSIVMMFRRREDIRAQSDHPWSRRLKLAGEAPNAIGKLESYNVDHVPLGLFWMYFAGILSALLGIGSGVLKVLAMDGAMKLPIKVSSATSNFMIGVTATASAGAYFVKGDVHPEIAAPVAVGILMGSWVGARVMVRMKPIVIRRLFIVLLSIVALQMIKKGLGL